MLNTAEYKVSVIMTVYNCAATIKEAVDSMLNQSFKDFCIILCDDGSTDGSSEIVDRLYSAKDNILIIHNKGNLGRAAASNRCIQLVKSKYIARMDGDDISLPDRLQEEVDFLENNAGYDIVSSPMIYFDGRGDYRVGHAVEYPAKSDFRYEAPFCHGPSMIRTEAMAAVGGYSENKDVVRVEDIDLWYRLYLKGYKGYNIQHPLYKMRNDKDAFLRRKPKYRIIQFRHGYKMRRAIGLKHAMWYSLPSLLKILVPWQLLYVSRRIR